MAGTGWDKDTLKPGDQITAIGHRISDGIYGVCDLPDQSLREFGIPITRWGGNTSSRYNWKINADNGANDWCASTNSQRRLSSRFRVA